MPKLTAGLNLYRFRRMDLGVSQAEAARASGRSAAFVSLLELGKATLPPEESTAYLAALDSLDPRHLSTGPRISSAFDQPALASFGAADPVGDERADAVAVEIQVAKSFGEDLSFSAAAKKVAERTARRAK